jgi:hypothetical protein
LANEESSIGGEWLGEWEQIKNLPPSPPAFIMKNMLDKEGTGTPKRTCPLKTLTYSNSTPQNRSCLCFVTMSLTPFAYKMNKKLK